PGFSITHANANACSILSLILSVSINWAQRDGGSYLSGKMVKCGWLEAKQTGSSQRGMLHSKDQSNFLK
ncbi:MAG TPA: hypothetical protein VFU49_07890, partial [Ktedonobacteraceae bacterium]|nr:hypothetical protein [Ktedonobacteraceae bacterium]